MCLLQFRMDRASLAEDSQARVAPKQILSLLGAWHMRRIMLQLTWRPLKQADEKLQPATRVKLCAANRQLVLPTRRFQTMTRTMSFHAEQQSYSGAVRWIWTLLQHTLQREIESREVKSAIEFRGLILVLS
jgi:hypothetical protein